MSELKTILKRHQLRFTKSRAAILDIFVEEEAALSERDIEESMQGSCDRVTIYRTLSSFLDHGLIHRVLDDSGAMKYALCAPNCHDGHPHGHDHVHFKCTNCGNTTCLDQVPIPAVKLPEGYLLSEVNMLLQGNCPTCAEA